MILASLSSVRGGGAENARAGRRRQDGGRRLAAPRRAGYTNGENF